MTTYTEFKSLLETSEQQEKRIARFVAGGVFNALHFQGFLHWGNRVRVLSHDRNTGRIVVDGSEGKRIIFNSPFIQNQVPLEGDERILERTPYKARDSFFLLL